MGRGMRRAGLAVLATLLALLLAAPGGAAEEATSNLWHTPPESAAFTVAGSNGYSISVRSERGMVTVVVSRQRPPIATFSPLGGLIPPNGGSYSASLYAAANRSEDPNAIDADFGSLGRISVAFQPDGRSHGNVVDLSGKTERCTGAAKVIRRLGSFVGTISFHGENGYTSVELASAPGSVGTSPFRDCTTRTQGRPGAGTQPNGPSSVSLMVDSGGDAGVPTFAALDGPGPPVFLAIAAERLTDSLIVLRTARAVGRGGTFVLQGKAHATVAPPPPFSGAASYRGGPHSPPRWSGDLAIEFPGLEVPLTGAQFEAPKLRR